jgi:hypothetical protein
MAPILDLGAAPSNLLHCAPKPEPEVAARAGERAFRTVFVQSWLPRVLNA